MADSFYHLQKSLFGQRVGSQQPRRTQRQPQLVGQGQQAVGVVLQPRPQRRAGIGISEVSDAVVVIVSEETGTISVAISGMLKRHLAPQTLEKLLLNELAPQREEKTRNPLKLLRRKQKENKDAKK